MEGPAIAARPFGNGIFIDNLNRATRTHYVLATRCFGLAVLGLALATSSFASPQSFRSPVIASTYSVTFADTSVGKTTPPQTVTVMNMVLAPAHITNVVVTGDFLQTNNCPAPPAALAQNDGCEIQVSFKPSAAQKYSGTLTIHHDGLGSPLTVELAGTGETGGEKAVAAPASLSFSPQKVGTDSEPQQATLSNQANRPITVYGIAIKGDFMILPSSTCEKLQGFLGANASCTLMIEFSPLQPGYDVGEITITDSAENSPQTISLSGTASQ